ncbi:hypothetical protein [Vibrio crassostreae]|uniref:hypothetical protein n=1 Tax=Vibrio crassostreae TaxID=246167 RepID=UPI001B309FBB|nr:hypothetical protein [Vibrio crassostreae]
MFNKYTTVPFALLTSIFMPLFTAAEEEDGISECEGAEDIFCFEVEARSNIFIEAVSMLFPVTTTEILYGQIDKENGGNAKDPDTFLSLLTEKISESLDEVSTKIVEIDGVAVLSTPISAYYEDRERFDTRPSKVFKDPTQQSYMHVFEQAVSQLFNIIGLFVMSVLSGSFIFRSVKIAFSTKEAGQVFRNMTLQTPLYLILASTLVSWDGGMPLLGQTFIAAYIIGSFLSSSVLMVFAPQLAEILSDDTVYRPESLGSLPSFQEKVNATVESLTDDLSKNIVLMDLKIMSDIGGEVNRVTDASFRSYFTEDKEHYIDSRCIDGEYWHFGVPFNPSCIGIKGRLNSTTAVVEDEFIGAGQLMLSRHLAKKFESELGLVVSVPEVSELMKKIQRETYRKVKIRKELVCSNSEYIQSKSQYKDQWFCLDFDYETGRFKDGKYLAESVLDSNIFGSSQKSFAKKLAAHQDSLGVTDTIDTREIASDIIAMLEKSSDYGFQETFKVRLHTDSVLNSFYSAINGVSRAQNMSNLMKTFSQDTTEDMFSHITRAAPFVEINSEGLAEADADRWYCFFELCDNVNSGFEKSNRQVDHALDKSPSGMAETVYRSISSKINDVRTSLDYEQNLFSNTKQLTSAGITFGTAAIVGMEIYESLKRDRLKKTQPWLSEEEVAMRVNHAIPNIFTKAVRFIWMLSVATFAFGLVSFSISFIMITLLCLLRLVQHTLFAALRVLSFLWDKDDSQVDESNVLIPETIKEALQRVLVEPLAVTCAFAIGVIVSLVAYKMARMMAIEVLDFAQKGNELLVIIYFVIELLIGIAISVVSLMVGSEFVTYTHEKLVEFLDDGISLKDEASKELTEGIKKSVSNLFNR